MEVIVGILLYLGVVTSPSEVTGDMIQKHETEISKVMNDEGAMADVVDIVGLVLVFPPDPK